MSDVLNPNSPPGGSGLLGDSDSRELPKFGYHQDLKRTLRFFSVFGASFSIISITTGIFLNYGVGIDNWGPASIWIWPVVGVGQIFVALVIAELGTRIPLAGYAYQWSSRLVNSTYGFFVGIAGLMYMTVGGGAIFLLVASPLLLSEFGINTPNSRLVLVVTFVLMLIPMIINIIGIQLATRINSVAVVTEIIGTVVFGVLLLVLWGVHSKPTTHGWSFLTSTASLNHNPLWYSVTIAALVGAYTLVGFELAADLSEEAINARFNVPRAVIWAVVGSVVLGFVALIGFTVAIPTLTAVEKSPLPLLTIANYWLSPWLVKVFVAFVVFSMFAISVVGSAAQARLVFSMGRDNMLPFSKVLSKVNPRTQTPIIALVVFGVIDIAFTWYGYLQSNTFNTLVGATAVLPFIIYFLITVAYAMKRRVMDSVPGAFSLKRSAPVVIGVVLVWTLMMIASLTLPSSFHGADRIVIGVGVLALIWYLAALRGRLSRGEAGVRPIEEMIGQ